MYIEKELWEELKKYFKMLDKYNNSNNDIRNIIYAITTSIEKIDNTKSNKVYVITNNAIVDDEIDYQIKGVAFTKDNAKVLFEEAIKDAKIDADFDNIDVVDVTNDTELSDEKWHFYKNDNCFELYLDGEYNSNNFSIQINEYDIDKNINKEKDFDL